jgi:plastocyanin
MDGTRWFRQKAVDPSGRRAAHVVLLSVGVALVVSCGSGPSAPSANDATIVIGPAGVTQTETRIKAWSRVTFMNNDTKPHTIVSDPVDLHTQCPPVNQVGLLNPGESRSTGTLNLTGTCGFHDHGNKVDASLMGRIVVE